MGINIGGAIKNFLSAKKASGLNGKQAFSNFIKDSEAKGFSTINYTARMHDAGGGVPAAKIATNSNIKQSDFIAIPGAENGEHYILPNFQHYTDNYHGARGLGDMFDSNFSSGHTYDIKNVANIVPGRGIVNADGTLTMTQRGSIDFGNGQPIERQLRNNLTGKYGAGSPDRGPITPEQQLSEELAAKNAEQLRQGGQSVAQPTPSKPVPEKTVTPVENEQPIISPEELARKNGFSLSSDGKIISPSSKQQGKSGAVTQEDIKRVQEQYSDKLKGEQARQNREQELRDDVARAQAEEHAELTGADDVIKDQPTPTKPIPDKTVTSVNPPVVGGKAAANENLIDIQEESAKKFFENPANQALAKQYNIEQNFEGMKLVKAIDENPASYRPVQAAFTQAKTESEAAALGVGSGKSLQEGTLSYTYDPEKVSDIEKMSSISDLGFSHMENGMKIAARELSIDEAKLKSLIKQNDMPGTKAANDMFYGRVRKGLESQHASIMKSDLSEADKIKKWDKAREEAIERLRNGATFQDYFFGNRVHHGLAGMAAITGTLGVAFGGHKSNAELYSSPF